MHLKVLVTEKHASGSYNWTSAATNLNDEVLEVGRDRHTDHFQKSWRNVCQMRIIKLWYN